ncbi:hypothetical protein Zm00014a_021835 [Zea mays]|uniref:Uncharacterized protein n=1 Tax=Zea mays TaxID=4577 RepID=A0A317Y8H4_MAIZE|nr:hypothetical protein Zm00014a_021835 [Zea mays]
MTTAPSCPRVRELCGDEHHPRNMVDNMALIIIDQTYSALLEIYGPEAPPSSDGHIQIQVSQPVDPADPDSPMLSVNASPTHCCISLTDTFYGGGGQDQMNVTSAEQSSILQYRLARSAITASPGTLHLARVDGGGQGDYWACADVRPDVANKGILGVLETTNARLDAAIQLEATLLSVAKKSGYWSPKVREIAEVHVALVKMRAATDIDAIMRHHRCLQNRRLLIQEYITCRPDADQACGTETALAKSLGTLHVGRKRGCPVQETMSDRLPESDDAEVLTKRLKALHIAHDCSTL